MPLPAQGKKTPRMMRRDNKRRRRRAVGVMMKGLEEEEEERRNNNGFGPENENGLSIGLWCKKNADIFILFYRFLGLGEEFLEEFGKGFTERSLKIGSGCFPAQVADHEMTMRVCLDFNHLCSIAIFILTTCLKNKK
ncbi:hypothetical protein ACB094_03G061000 [Castanea mollissima]